MNGISIALTIRSLDYYYEPTFALLIGGLNSYEKDNAQCTPDLAAFSSATSKQQSISGTNILQQCRVGFWYLRSARRCGSSTKR